MSSTVRSPTGLRDSARMANSRLGSGNVTVASCSTVTDIVALALNPASSVAMIVMVVVPVWFRAGVTVIKPAGSSAKPESGTRLGFEETAEVTTSTPSHESYHTLKGIVEGEFAAMIQLVGLK